MSHRSLLQTPACFITYYVHYLKGNRNPVQMLNSSSFTPWLYPHIIGYRAIVIRGSLSDFGAQWKSPVWGPKITTLTLLTNCHEREWYLNLTH